MRGIIAIVNNCGERESTWKIAVWIFTYAKVFPLAVNSAFKFFMASMMKLVTFFDILYIFRHSIVQIREVIS